MSLTLGGAVSPPMFAGEGRLSLGAGQSSRGMAGEGSLRLSGDQAGRGFAGEGHLNLSGDQVVVLAAATAAAVAGSVGGVPLLFDWISGPEFPEFAAHVVDVLRPLLHADPSLLLLGLRLLVALLIARITGWRAAPKHQP